MWLLIQNPNLGREAGMDLDRSSLALNSVSITSQTEAQVVANMDVARWGTQTFANSKSLPFFRWQLRVINNQVENSDLFDPRLITFSICCVSALNGANELA